MSPRSRVAAAKIAIVAVVLVAIIAGGAGIYYYTSAPPGFSSQTSSTTTASGVGGSGYQDSSGQPQGAWAGYLGFIPAGYVVAPHQGNAPTFECPPGMSSSACTQFKQSCGNGVCDPNESCATCPIDCAPTGSLECDPYTGRPGMPASVCQAMFAQNQGAAVG
jgi:hypothetical protein